MWCGVYLYGAVSERILTLITKSRETMQEGEDEPLPAQPLTFVRSEKKIRPRRLGGRLGEKKTLIQFIIIMDQKVSFGVFCFSLTTREDTPFAPDQQSFSTSFLPLFLMLS